MKNLIDIYFNTNKNLENFPFEFKIINKNKKILQYQKYKDYFNHINSNRLIPKIHLIFIKYS